MRKVQTEVIELKNIVAKLKYNEVLNIKIIEAKY